MHIPLWLVHALPKQHEKAVFAIPYNSYAAGECHLKNTWRCMHFLPFAPFQALCWNFGMPKNGIPYKNVGY
jgi:hypothetical protein